MNKLELTYSLDGSNIYYLLKNTNIEDYLIHRLYLTISMSDFSTFSKIDIYDYYYNYKKIKQRNKKLNNIS